MINMPLAVFTLSLSSAVFAIDLPQAPIPYLSPVKSVRVVKKQKPVTRHVHAAKSRLFLAVPKLVTHHDIDDNDYSNDTDDEITIQSITQIRTVKKQSLGLDINDEVAERLAMIKWIVLARLANPNFHKV